VKVLNGRSVRVLELVVEEPGAERDIHTQQNVILPRKVA
jgi:hypothetical protein